MERGDHQLYLPPVTQNEVNNLVLGDYVKKMVYDTGMVPSWEDESSRLIGLGTLGKLGAAWTPDFVLVPIGSFALGVHTSDSDVDLLCIYPSSTPSDDFFTVFGDIVSQAPGTSEVVSIRSAKFPLLKLKLNGVSYELVPKPVEPSVLRHLMLDLTYCIDSSCDPALSSATSTYRILKLMQHVQVFKDALRWIKCWASKRGIYEAQLGKLGGVHLAVLVTYICMRHPDGSLASILSLFFSTFANWNWSTSAVIVDPSVLPPGSSSHHPRYFMRIQSLGNDMRQPWCSSKVTQSTYEKIVAELKRGHERTQCIDRLTWKTLFDPFDYSTAYGHYVKIEVSAPTETELQSLIGLLQSHSGTLLRLLEGAGVFCDPDGMKNNEDEAVVFYWGVTRFERRDSYDLTDLTPVVTNLTSMTMMHLGNGRDIKLSIV